MSNDRKKRINVVYSTNPDFAYEYAGEAEPETLAPERQNLRVVTDTKQRKGKTVTLVQGFVGTSDDLEALARLLNPCRRLPRKITISVPDVPACVLILQTAATRSANCIEAFKNRF